MEIPDRCHLLRLPAEIRNSIYEFTLAPTGTLALLSTEDEGLGISPVIGPSLLATCRQINAEASDILYASNLVCITIEAYNAYSPLISEERLPQCVLEKLQHVFVIFDATVYIRTMDGEYFWTPFSALTTLRTLRVAIINSDWPPAPSHMHSHVRYEDETVEHVLWNILAWVPASTSVVYGTEPGSEERQMSDQALQQDRCREILGTSTVTDVDGGELADVALKVTKYCPQGRESGVVWRVYEERLVFRSPSCKARFSSDSDSDSDSDSESDS